jgi:hypothetical protein
MKLVYVVIVFALALAGLGVACGPEETYCYDQHLGCNEARQIRLVNEAQEAGMTDDAQPVDDGGATVLDH